jgi:hypothetical protein
MRWPTDIRVSNVSTMLDSSKPVLIPVSKMTCLCSKKTLFLGFANVDLYD